MASASAAAGGGQLGEGYTTFAARMREEALAAASAAANEGHEVSWSLYLWGASL